MNKIELTVVICTLNREKHLERCLETLVNQSLDKELYEVLIINNNSIDNTQIVAERFTEAQPNFHLIREETHGLSKCRNIGWKKANGKHVAYIDDDAKANSDWCAKILNAFKTVTPSPVAVGGVILPFYDRKPPFWFSDSLESCTWGSSRKFLNHPKKVNSFAGSNMAFSKKTLEEYGGFSPDYGMVGEKVIPGEEIDLFNRISQKTLLFWYDPEIKVYHWVSPKKMKISYRMFRAFSSNLFTVEATGQDYLSPSYIKSWIHHRRKAEGCFFTHIIFWLEQFARVLGYICKKLFINTKPKD